MARVTKAEADLVRKFWEERRSRDFWGRWSRSAPDRALANANMKVCEDNLELMVTWLDRAGMFRRNGLERVPTVDELVIDGPDA